MLRFSRRAFKDHVVASVVLQRSLRSSTGSPHTGPVSAKSAFQNSVWQHCLQAIRTSIQSICQTFSCQYQNLFRIVHCWPWERDLLKYTGKTSITSRLINLAISNPAIWAIMRAGARHQMTTTAERSGIPWAAASNDLKNTPEVSCVSTPLGT